MKLDCWTGWIKAWAVILIAASLPGLHVARAANVGVNIQNFAFSPGTITIDVGDTITWTNLDFDSHTSTSGNQPNADGKWDSGFLSRNQTFAHTFDAAGTFPYFCIPHFGMRGTVIVRQAQAQTPTVSITAPANNATFTAPANVTIEANAAVNGSTISSVEFFDGNTSLGTDNSAPYSVNATLQAGTHSLTARAAAANGQSATSAVITVSVNAAQAPTISITAPANNTTLVAPANITIEATAAVTDSTITTVEFFDGSTFLGADRFSPYAFATTLQAGTHTLTARATAANGQMTTSSSINVTVNAPDQAPSVSITSPANNATIQGTSVTIVVEATATGGATVTMVEFYDGANFLDMLHGAPFTLTKTLAVGSHTLTARAMSSTGLTATSAPVNITIALAAVRIENPYPNAIVKSDLTIELQTVAEGLISPLGMAAPNDGRLFVFDQVGLIHVIANGAMLPDPLLDIRSRLVTLSPGYDERGLLGLALHPNFAQNGLLYTYTSEPNGAMADFMIMGTEANDHQSVVTEWKIDPANTNRVDVGSRREVMRIDQPQFNHNGGAMHFGTDGMLYIALGDGGAADDEESGHSPQGNGQDLEKILGKMVRIDVNTRTSANSQYGVPSDNPFVGQPGLDEIHAYGFRNPYTWSFDKLTGEMYVADVGQNQIEEVDRVFKGGNYGWRIKEGTFFFHPDGTNAGFISATAAVEVPANLIDPIAEYDHSEGTAIVGGSVYRGTKLPGLMGKYVAGDFGTFDAPAGRLFFLDRNEFREFRIGENNRALGLWLKGFGEDTQGEIYVMGSSVLGPSGTGGKVLKIVPVTSSINITSIHRDGTNVMVTFTGGVGPFVLQGKTSLDDGMWHTAAASSQRAITVPMDGRFRFFRIAEGAGNAALAFTVSMTGAAERPNLVVTTATGTGTLSLEGNTLHFDIRYTGLSGTATAAHIHGPASAAVAAGVIINLAPFNGGAFGSSGVLAGSVTLTPEHKAQILSGKTYVNVHTALNPGGEIRGQVAPVVFMADLSGSAERPTPVQTAGQGSAILLLVGNKLTFNLDYGGLAAVATAAHIHGATNSESAAGVLVNLAPFNGGSFGASGAMGGTITLEPNHLAALVDGLTYANIHTSLNPGGEIRGQILPMSTAIPLSAALNGDAERPDPVQTTATGSGTFALEGHTLHFNVRYEGLKAVATAAHIHGPASAALAAGVLINLAPYNGGAFGTNGTLAGRVTLTDEQRAWVLQGRTYVNVHTSVHPGGEIRGQIAPALMHAEMLGASERANGVLTTGKGRGTFLLVGSDLTVAATYSELPVVATLAHIHGSAGTGATAGVMQNMEPLNGGAFGTSGSFAGSVALTPAQLAALIDGLTYFNIHTSRNPSGEIRGQIVR